jgi:hypothetical protein
MKERKKWSVIAISLFVLAVVLAVGGRFLLPKPTSEVEAVVEQYLLMRTGFMAIAALLAFLGLLVMAKKLRCPHCGAMALRKIIICDNCGKDYDAEVVAEEAEPVAEAAAIAEPVIEAAEAVPEEK